MDVETRKHILFVDLGMHKNTGSAQFFVELLRRKYDVDVCYVVSRRDTKMPTKQTVAKYDAIVYWQVTPSNVRAKSFGKPSIYVPMYDGETFNIFNWKQRCIAGAKAICFCEKEADFLVRAGFAPLRVKYYPKIGTKASGNPRRLFFWDRIQKLLHAPGQASFLTLKKLFGIGDLDGMIVRCTKRRATLISDDDKVDYNVEILPAEEHLSQEEYFAMYSDCGIFATSRANEGIGMGFLEAMAMGKCVIVNNDATFNEYVRDGVSGILIDYNNPESSREKVSKADIARIQRDSYQQCVEGRRRWESEYEPAILSFMGDAIKQYHRMKLVNSAQWWCLLPLKFCFDVKNWLQGKWKVLKSDSGTTEKKG